MATFNFVGMLRPIKDKDNFKGFTTTNYESGWMTEKLRFNIIAGDNRHLVEINAGRWSDENKNIIYTSEKVAGNNKGKPIQVFWNERKDPEIIDKIVGWRIFTVDTDTYNHRQELEASGDVAALEVSKNKRRHFLAGTDFCEYANKLINSEKAKDWKFRVTGNINYTYSAKNDTYYATYEVTKIYRVDDDKEPSSEVTMDFYFTEGAMDSSDFNEVGKVPVIGYTTFYDNTTKKNWFCPVNLIVRENVDGWNDIFNEFEDKEVRKIGLVCQKIDGAQKVNIKLENLSDRVRRNIERGLITEADAIREAGGQMYGDNVRELRIVGFGKGYSEGSVTTIYTVENLMARPIEKTLAKPKMEDEENIFDEDDDL